MSDPFSTDVFKPDVQRPQVQSPSLRRSQVVIPTGPRLYQRIRKPLHTGGPGIPPPDFVTNTTSASEWMWYWASKRVLDPDVDPRHPPFNGGRLWSYQAQELARYEGARGKALSTNVDFLYRVSYPELVVRIMTYRYHEATNAIQQAYDHEQQRRLLGSFDEVEVFEADFVGDPTGEAAIVLLKETLGLIRRRDPLTSHQVLLVRTGRT